MAGCYLQREPLREGAVELHALLQEFRVQNQRQHVPMHLLQKLQTVLVLLQLLQGVCVCVYT